MATATVAMSVDVDDLVLADTDFFCLPRRNHRTIIRSQVARLVDLLAQYDARCTWFVPGYILDVCPDVMDDALGLHHEIACHGHRHIPAYRHTPASFEDDLGEAVDRIRRASGVVPIGYRAPGFTLLPAAERAAPILLRLGFRYSSSVPAVALGQHRYRTAGPLPFRWPCGLAELPPSIQKVWGMRVPVCGSVFTRLLPRSLVRNATERFARESDGPLFYYLHPFEAFPEESPSPVILRGLRSRLYAARRGRSLGELEWVLGRFSSIPYAEAALTETIGI